MAGEVEGSPQVVIIEFDASRLLDFLNGFVSRPSGSRAGGRQDVVFSVMQPVRWKIYVQGECQLIKCCNI